VKRRVGDDVEPCDVTARLPPITSRVVALRWTASLISVARNFSSTFTGFDVRPSLTPASNSAAGGPAGGMRCDVECDDELLRAYMI